MPDYPFAKQLHSSAHQAQMAPPPRISQPSAEELSRIFNSALVATQVSGNSNPAAELQQLMESSAFQAIIQAIRQVVRSEGISEKQAAEQLIHTFRRMDEIWSNYVFQEGVERLRNHLG